MNVTFYNFSKRRNSTKRPSGGTSYSCLLKDDTSTARPSIAIKWDGTSSAPAGFNYCYIPDFGRYYWVNSWTYSERQWVAACSVDVLATYKTEIGSSYKYILRSASERDGDVLDTRYPAKGVCQKTVVTNIGPSWPQSYTGGRYVVGITGQGNTFSSGGIGFIVCTASQLQSILNAAYTGAAALWPTTTGSGVGEALAGFGDNLQKSLTQPYQFINSVVWLPFVPDTGGATTVSLGSINTGISVGTLDRPYTSIVFTFNINTYPAGIDAPEWQNLPPYVRYIFEYPPFGVHELDATVLRRATKISCTITVDNTNGEAYLTATAGDSGGATLVAVPSKLGVEIPIAGIMKDTLGAVGGIAKAAVSAIVNPSVGSKIGGALSGIGDAVQAMQPQAVGGGNIGGGFAALHGNRRFTTLYYPAVDQDNLEQGSPLCTFKTISTLSGFVMCADGEVDCNATAAEHSELESFLTGGFFYE